MASTSSTLPDTVVPLVRTSSRLAAKQAAEALKAQTQPLNKGGDDSEFVSGNELDDDDDDMDVDDDGDRMEGKSRRKAAASSSSKRKKAAVDNDVEDADDDDDADHEEKPQRKRSRTSKKKAAADAEAAAAAALRPKPIAPRDPSLPLPDLPTEVWSLILSHHTSPLAVVRQVCRAWRQIAYAVAEVPALAPRGFCYHCLLGGSTLRACRSAGDGSLVPVHSGSRNVKLCGACQMLPGYRRMFLSEATGSFSLSAKDIDDYGIREVAFKQNPHYRSAAPMRFFAYLELETAALQKFGTKRTTKAAEEKRLVKLHSIYKLRRSCTNQANRERRSLLAEQMAEFAARVKAEEQRREEMQRHQAANVVVNAVLDKHFGKTSLSDVHRTQMLKHSCVLDVIGKYISGKSAKPVTAKCLNECLPVLDRLRELQLGHPVHGQAGPL